VTDGLHSAEMSGQVAVVTGASRGLGRAFALGLAGTGAAVAVVARTETALAETARQIRERGGQALALPLDVTEESAVTDAVYAIERRLGSITILVNGAGVMAPVGTDWNVDPTEWWRTMEINVRGSFLCTRAVVPSMIERHSGRIINISSSAINKRYPYYSAYGASKAALTHMTGSLADALKPHSVSAFAFSPGFVRTEMTEALADSAALREFQGDGFRRALDEGRCTPIDRAVRALLYLASGAADVLSGRFIDVSDDLVALTRRADHLVEAVSGSVCE
jgi:NAD(P)-dependent dehydrogenase (short-subunit alcohol dehydrogenase family)